MKPLMKKSFETAIVESVINERVCYVKLPGRTNPAKVSYVGGATVGQKMPVGWVNNDRQQPIGFGSKNQVKSLGRKKSKTDDGYWSSPYRNTQCNPYINIKLPSAPTGTVTQMTFINNTSNEFTASSLVDIYYHLDRFFIVVNEGIFEVEFSGENIFSVIGKIQPQEWTDWECWPGWIIFEGEFLYTPTFNGQQQKMQMHVVNWKENTLIGYGDMFSTNPWNSWTCGSPDLTMTEKYIYTCYYSDTEKKIYLLQFNKETGSQTKKIQIYPRTGVHLENAEEETPQNIVEIYSASPGNALVSVFANKEKIFIVPESIRLRETLKSDTGVDITTGEIHSDDHSNDVFNFVEWNGYFKSWVRRDWSHTYTSLVPVPSARRIYQFIESEAGLEECKFVSDPAIPGVHILCLDETCSIVWEHFGCKEITPMAKGIRMPKNIILYCVRGLSNETLVCNKVLMEYNIDSEDYMAWAHVDASSPNPAYEDYSKQTKSIHYLKNIESYLCHLKIDNGLELGLSKIDPSNSDFYWGNLSYNHQKYYKIFENILVGSEYTVIHTNNDIIPYDFINIAYRFPYHSLNIGNRSCLITSQNIVLTPPYGKDIAFGSYIPNYKIIRPLNSVDESYSYTHPRTTTDPDRTNWETQLNRPGFPDSPYHDISLKEPALPEWDGNASIEYTYKVGENSEDHLFKFENLKQYQHKFYHEYYKYPGVFTYPDFVPPPDQGYFEARGVKIGDTWMMPMPSQVAYGLEIDGEERWAKVEPGDYIEYYYEWDPDLGLYHVFIRTLYGKRGTYIDSEGDVILYFSYGQPEYGTDWLWSQEYNAEVAAERALYEIRKATAQTLWEKLKYIKSFIYRSESEIYSHKNFYPTSTPDPANAKFWHVCYNQSGTPVTKMRQWHTINPLYNTDGEANPRFLIPRCTAGIDKYMFTIETCDTYTEYGVKKENFGVRCHDFITGEKLFEKKLSELGIQNGQTPIHSIIGDGNFFFICQDRPWQFGQPAPVNILFRIN